VDGCVALMMAVFSSVALASPASSPVGGGHYKGSDDSTASFSTDHSVALVVSKNGAEFARDGSTSL
jgi:hypothetical protein